MLYHFSDDPSIETFFPRKSTVYPDMPPVVWAIDSDHAHLYFFPRDCPRICFTRTEHTSTKDIERFFRDSVASTIVTVESSWFERIGQTKLYVYEFDDEGFTCIDAGAGYFISEQLVVPKSVKPVGDLFTRLVDSGVEIRITPSLKPLCDALVNSSVQFSMIRMKNAVLT